MAFPQLQPRHRDRSPNRQSLRRRRRAVRLWLGLSPLAARFHERRPVNQPESLRPALGPGNDPEARLMLQIWRDVRNYYNPAGNWPLPWWRRAWITWKLSRSFL